MLYNKQVKNSGLNLPNTDLGNVVQINNQLNQGIQNSLKTADSIIQQEANKQYQLAYETFTFETQTSMQNLMNKAFDNNVADPVGLENEFNEIRKEIFKNVKNDNIKLGLEKNYLTLKNTYLQKSEENRKIKADKTAKETIQNNINTLLKPLQLYQEKIYNGTLTQDDIFNYNMQREKIRQMLSTRGEQKDRIGENILLFSEAEINDIESEFSRIKLDTGLKFINEKFEKSPEEFISIVNSINNKPQETIERFGLTQEEYEKLKRYSNSLMSIYEDNNKKISGSGEYQQSQQEIVDINNDWLEYKKTIDILSLGTEEGTKNKIKANLHYNLKVNTLITANNYLESARMKGLSDNKYIDEKAKIYNVCYNNFFEGEDINKKQNKKWLFFKKDNVNSVVVDFLNKNYNDFEKNKKVDLYLEVASVIQRQGLDLRSENLEDVENVKKIILDIVRNREGIAKDENFEMSIQNKKIQNKIEYQNNIIQEYQNNDPFNLL